MIPPRRRVALALGLLAVTLVAPKAWAGEPADQLLAQIDQVVKVLDDPELKQPAKRQERLQEIRLVANNLLDYEEITKRSLGRHWQTRTAVERDEFVQVFGDLLERAYIGRLETFNGEKIAILGDAIDGDQAVVRTKVVTRQGAEIPVDYRMLRRGDRWRACDVVIEGISLVANYRAQFDRIIQHTSYQQLVRQVREKQ